MRLYSLAAIWLTINSVFVTSDVLAQGDNPPAERRPVPARDELSKAESQVRALFRVEILAAKKAAEKQALAQKLLETAKDSNDDPTSKYVLLRQAIDLMSDAEDFEASEEALEELIAGYQVDAWKERFQFVKVSSVEAKSPEGRAMMLKLSESLVSRAAEEEQFETAAQILGEAALLANRAKDPKLAITLRKQRDHIGDLQRLAEAATAAKKTLETSPNDAAAHLVLGQYLCFVRHDWDKGLPHLAQGNDEPLKELAKQELAKPDTAPAKLVLADAWSKLGDKSTGSHRVFALQRAQSRYRLVLEDLKGLEKLRVEKRLTELDSLIPREQPAELAQAKDDEPKPPPEKPAKPAPEKPRTVAKAGTPAATKKGRPNSSNKPNPDKPFESVREGVAWLYSMNISSFVSAGGQSASGLIDPQKLPPGDVVVRGLTLDTARNPQCISPQSLAKLGYFSEINVLTLDGLGVTDQLLAALPEFRLLEALTLGRQSQFTSNGFKSLERFQKLRDLVLNGGQFDEFPEYQRPMPIASVTYDSTLVSERKLKSLAQFSSLRSLRLQNCRLSGTPLEVIPTLSLQNLTLSGLPIGDREVNSLLPLRDVISLDLTQTQVTDAGLTSLKRMEKLSVLRLGGTGVTDKTVESLAELPNLNHLALDDTRVTGSGFEKFPENSAINYLSLRNSQLNDQTLKRLPAFERLDGLILSGSPVTDNGLLTLRKLPKLGLLFVSSKTSVAAEQALKAQFPKLNLMRTN